MAFDAGLMPPRPRRTPYAPAQSLQFSAAQSQYLTRTPGVTGNLKKWTASWWIKKTKLNAGSGNCAMLAAGTGGGDVTVIAFGYSGSEQLRFYYGGAPNEVYTNPLYRDVTAFAHIVVQFDSDQATASDRLKFFWNGERITSFASTTYPGLAGVTAINNNVAQYFGRWAYSVTDHLDGPVADICFVDDAIIDPTSFGGFNDFGQWVPKRPAVVTWGTNGFWLDGEMSGTTVLDKSGNGNDWTVVNGVVECLDVPGDKASANLGNYARINALKNGGLTISRAATRCASIGSTGYIACGTFGPVTEKVYFEAPFTNLGPSLWGEVGFVRKDMPLPTAATPYPRTIAGGMGWQIDSGSTNDIQCEGVTVTNTLAAFFGAVVQVAYDPATGKMWLGRNNTWNNGGNPAAGTGESCIMSAAYRDVLVPYFGIYGTGGSYFDFLTDPTKWTYTPPTGFKPLCTAHLPTKAPKDLGAQVGVLTWNGDASVSRDIIGLPFTPQFALPKCRSFAHDWWLVDALRGPTKGLITNSTAAEGTDATAVNAFINGGIRVGNGSTCWAGVNASGKTYTGLFIGGLYVMTAPEIAALVAASGATITPSAIAYDATLGMAIIKYTGNGVAGAKIPHSLGKAPAMIIDKAISAATDWPVYHRGLTSAAYRLLLDATSGQISHAAFNNTAPTATVFSVGPSGYMTNNSGVEYIAYCFANTDAIKVGSYTGNGSADGPFVDLGGEPLWKITKRVDSTSSWTVHDGVRNPYNVVNLDLYADLPNAEAAAAGQQEDFTAAGFKLRGTGNEINASGATYIYLAFIDRYFGGANVAQGRAR